MRWTKRFAVKRGKERKKKKGEREERCRVDTS
jgi:hypothetical protein